MTAQNFTNLLNKWRSGQMSRGDAENFLTALQGGDFDELLEDIMTLDFQENLFEKGATQAIKSKDWRWIEENINKSKTLPVVHRVHLLKTAWFRWAAAIIILAGTGTYIFTSQSEKEVVQTTPSVKPNDILPGYNRAVLTLSDGQKVELDSAASETINDGNLSIKNNNGQLLYANSERGSLSPAGGSPREAREGGPATYNTMSTPRGGQYQLTLSDGTKVWLNAASSITFPTAFKGKSREVSIKGEAYFEVAKNKEKPFVVKAGTDAITVLGTSFNINAYTDEVVVKTTLVDGSIKIRNRILQPGQAFVNGTVMLTNVAKDIAWKNGIFDFQGLSVHQAMKQIARWYDIEVQFDGDFSQREIRGKIDRSLNLAEVLSVMERTNMHFILKGRSLKVHE